MYSRKPTQGKEGNAMFSIACLFAVQFVSFLEGRGIGAVPFPFPGIIVGIFCGLLCGGLLFSTRLGKQYASLWLLSLTAVSVLLWGNVLRNNDALSCYGSMHAGSGCFAPRAGASSRRKPLTGAACGHRVRHWRFLLAFSLPAASSAFSKISSRDFTGASVRGRRSGSLRSVESEPRRSSRSRAGTDASGVPAIRVAGISHRHHARILYSQRVHRHPVLPDARRGLSHTGSGSPIHMDCLPIDGPVHRQTWRGHAPAPRLSGGQYPSPTLIAITEGTVLYWFIYTVVLASRSASLLYLLLVFARINRQFQYRKLVIIIPYLAMLAAFMGTSIFVEYFPGTLHTFCGASFSPPRSAISARASNTP